MAPFCGSSSLFPTSTNRQRGNNNNTKHEHAPSLSLHLVFQYPVRWDDVERLKICLMSISGDVIWGMRTQVCNYPRSPCWFFPIWESELRWVFELLRPPFILAVYWCPWICMHVVDLDSRTVRLATGELSHYYRQGCFRLSSTGRDILRWMPQWHPSEVTYCRERINREWDANLAG
jgi:hypothetical protein